MKPAASMDALISLDIKGSLETQAADNNPFDDDVVKADSETVPFAESDHTWQVKEVET